MRYIQLHYQCILLNWCKNYRILRWWRWERRCFRNNWLSLPELLKCFSPHGYGNSYLSIAYCQGGIWKNAFNNGRGFYNSGYGGYRFQLAGMNGTCLNVNGITGVCSCPAGRSAVVVSSQLLGSGGFGSSTITTYTCQ